MYNKLHLNFYSLLYSELKSERLFESEHIFFNCQEVFKTISNTIYNDFLENYIAPERKYTGYGFYPESADCKQIETQDNIKPETKKYFPIYIEYVICPTQMFYMVIADREESPDEVLIIVNISNILRLKMNNKLTEQFIYSKLRHEVKHMREQYARFDLNPYKAKKYEINCPRIFNFGQFNNDIYSFIDDILYLFSEAEINARIDETIYALDSLNRDEFNRISDGTTSMTRIISKYIDYTRDNNLIYMMTDRIKDIEESRNDQQYAWTVLPVAFFFKYFQRYYTKDQLTVDYINSIINKSPLEPIDEKYI